MIGGIRVRTYIVPWTSPSSAATETAVSRVSQGPVPHCWESVPATVAESRETAPREKSKRPESRLTERANVVRVTLTAALKKSFQLSVLTNRRIPLAMAIIASTIRTPQGIRRLSNTFFSKEVFFIRITLLDSIVKKNSGAVANILRPG